MNKPLAITAFVDAETLKAVEAAAGTRGITVEEFAAMAIAITAADARAQDEAPAGSWDDPEFRAFIQEGLDDIEAGRVYTQEQMDEWFAERIAAARAKAAE